MKEFTKGLKMPVYVSDGKNALDAYSATASAVKYARKKKRPSMVVYDELPRRFGHAATDRQNAYMSMDEIDAAAARNPLAQMAQQAVELGVATWEELYKEYVSIEKKVEKAFQVAANEEKITTRKSLIDSNSQPLAPLPEGATRVAKTSMTLDLKTNEASMQFDRKNTPKADQPTVMRKNMNRVIEEVLTEKPNVVYIGEVRYPPPLALSFSSFVSLCVGVVCLCLCAFIVQDHPCMCLSLSISLSRYA